MKNRKYPEHKNAVAKHAYGFQNVCMYTIVKDMTPLDAMQALTDLIGVAAGFQNWEEIVPLTWTDSQEAGRNPGLFGYWIVAKEESFPTLHASEDCVRCCLALVHRIREQVSDWSYVDVRVLGHIIDYTLKYLGVCNQDKQLYTWKQIINFIAPRTLDCLVRDGHMVPKSWSVDDLHHLIGYFMLNHQEMSPSYHSRLLRALAGQRIRILPHWSPDPKEFGVALA